MPFEARPVELKAHKALAEALAAHKAMRAHEAGRAKEVARRAKALTKAHDAGMSYEALADALGVTRQRVRQMMGQGK